MTRTGDRHSATQAWLPLGAASRFLGVDGDTLRRWADAGRVEAFTTPGGHRRFSLRSLERLIATRRPGARPTLARLGATPERFAAAYRRSYGARSAAIDVAVRLPDRELFRVDGRRLVEALVRHLDAAEAAERQAAEEEALGIARAFARRLASEGIGLPGAIEHFVAAREAFLGELATAARRRPFDPGALGALYEDASGFLDRLLVAFVAAHSPGPDTPAR